MAKNQKEIRQFLRERKLTASFNKWRSIKRLKKRVIDVSYSNYDGTIKRGRVYVYRQKNRTVFRDYETLLIVAKSKRKLSESIKAAFTRTETFKPYKVRGWDVGYSFKDVKLKLKNVSKTQSYNQALERLRTVERRNTIRRKMQGMVVCDLTYVASNGSRKRIQIRSKLTFLGNKQTRDKLVNENISNGSGLAEFSPVDVIINGIWFEYWIDKHEKLKKLKKVR